MIVSTDGTPGEARSVSNGGGALEAGASLTGDGSSDRFVSRRRVRPAKAKKTAMAVAQRIVDEISMRQYPPGTKLPPEQQMLGDYQVGRGTLRESLRFLEMNGVITMKPGPGGGPIVGAPDSRDLAGTLGLFMQLHSTTFGSIIQLRQVIEPAVTALAATQATEEMIEELGRSVEAMEAELKSTERFLEENQIFHEVVAQASGNPVFSLLISSLWFITDEHAVGIEYPLSRRQAVVRAHWSIYEGLAAADVTRAQDAMTEHMTELATYVHKYYPNVVTGPLRWQDVTD